MRILLLFLVTFSLVFSYSNTAFGIFSEQAPHEPQTITNGSFASDCQFPSALSVVNYENELVCSAVLVRDDIILLAGHCIKAFEGEQGPFDTQLFAQSGEDSENPVESSFLFDCRRPPSFDKTLSTGDIAFCKLPTPFRNIPVVPFADGCEVDELQEGSELTIVGFGVSQAHGDIDGEKHFSPDEGKKRYTSQKIHRIFRSQKKMAVVGEQNNSGCYGDSGGPAFLQLANGQYRTVGIASHLYFPDGDRPGGDEELCGKGLVYTSIHPYIRWLEDEIDEDITPCFDNGKWNPGIGCYGFPTRIDSDKGTWRNSCQNDEISSFVETCGPPFARVVNQLDPDECDEEDDSGSNEEPFDSTQDLPSSDPHSEVDPEIDSDQERDLRPNSPSSAPSINRGCRSSSDVSSLPLSTFLLLLLIRRRTRTLT